MNIPPVILIGKLETLYMKPSTKKLGAMFIASSALLLAACSADEPQTAAVPVEQSAAQPEVKPVVSKTKPAFAVFTISTGMIHVLSKPKSGPADLVYQNSCPAGSRPFGIADINFGGKLFCNDAANRRITVMDMSSSAELFSWGWPAEVKGSPAWFIGRWQVDRDVGLAAYDSAKGIYHVFNSEDKGFSLSHSFEYGGTEGATQPLVGDWDGDGTDSAGVYRSATRQVFLRNVLDAGMADISFGLDESGYEPDAMPVMINLDGRSAVAMYSSNAAIVVFTPAEASKTPFLFGAPAEEKVVVPIR